MSLTNLEIAQNILKAYKLADKSSNENRSLLNKCFRDAFDGNSIYQLCFLASDWPNDLIEWVENEIRKEKEEESLYEQQKTYIQKLRTEVFDYINSLNFENKQMVIECLSSICNSMIYSAPESFRNWIEEYFEQLNKYLKDISDEEKNKLLELLKK